MNKKTFTYKSIAYNRGYNIANEVSPECPYDSDTQDERDWLVGLGDGIKDLEMAAETEQPTRKFSKKFLRESEDNYEAEENYSNNNPEYYPDTDY